VINKPSASLLSFRPLLIIFEDNFPILLGMALSNNDKECAPEGSNSNAVSSQLVTELGDDTQHSAVVDRIREHVSSSGTYSLVELTFEKAKSNSPLIKGKQATAYLDRFASSESLKKGTRVAVNLGIDKNGYPSIAAGGKGKNFPLTKKPA